MGGESAIRHILVKMAQKGFGAVVALTARFVFVTECWRECSIAAWPEFLMLLPRWGVLSLSLLCLP
jgi:hypothetical protein